MDPNTTLIFLGYTHNSDTRLLTRTQGWSILRCHPHFHHPLSSSKTQPRSQELAEVAIVFLFRTYSHPSIVDPTSSVLAGTRQRYRMTFPPRLDLSGFPFLHALGIALVSPMRHSTHGGGPCINRMEGLQTGWLRTRYSCACPRKVFLVQIPKETTLWGAPPMPRVRGSFFIPSPPAFSLDRRQLPYDYSH